MWLPGVGSASGIGCRGHPSPCLGMPTGPRPALAAQVGPDEHVICALSGGVDSTVAATLVHRVLGDRLHCVFVDNGLLRYKARLTALHARECVPRP